MYFKNKEKEVEQLEFSHQLWFLSRLHQIAPDLEDRRPRTIKYPRGTEEASLLRPQPLLSYIIYHSRRRAFQQILRITQKLYKEDENSSFTQFTNHIIIDMKTSVASVLLLLQHSKIDSSRFQTEILNCHATLDTSKSRIK